MELKDNTITKNETLPNIEAIGPKIIEKTNTKDDSLKQVSELKAKISSFKKTDTTKNPFEVKKQEEMFLNSVKEIMPVKKQDAFDLSKKDLAYVEKYRKLQLRETDGNYNHFILTPRHRKEIVDLLPTITENLYKELTVTDEVVTKWPESTISAILSKGLILESVKYSQHIGKSVSQLLKDSHLSQKDDMKICDLCVGTGITSSQLWSEFKNTLPNKNLQIHAVDNSIESIAASMCLFETQKIPYLVLKNIENLSEIPKDFNGIVLITTDAIEFLESHKPDDVAYDASVSENGISYFTPEKHKKALDLMVKSTNNDGIIGISSLDPNLTVNLDKKFLLREIITGSNKFEEYSKKIETGKEKQYEIKEGEIKKAMTKETGGQIELLNNLLKTDLPTFISYMKGLSSATKAAKVLVSEIKSPINETKQYINEQYPNWEFINEQWNIENAPCNVMIVKI